MSTRHKLAERPVAALLSQAGIEPKEGEMIGSSFGGAWDSSHRPQCLIKLFPLDLPILREAPPLPP